MQAHCHWPIKDIVAFKPKFSFSRQHLCAKRFLQAFLVTVVLFSGCRRETDSSGVIEGNENESTSGEFAPGSTVYQDAMRWSDVTLASQVISVYRNGEQANERSIVESLGGGVGIFDYDADGCMDLVFPGGGTLAKNQALQGEETRLFRQQSPFHFVDTSSLSGIAKPTTYTHGVAAGDFNNDGFADVLITGYGGLQLMENQGDGTFIDVTQSSGLDDKAWSSSAAWLDIDSDGDLDLYVCHYVNWSWENHPTCPASVAGEIDICSPNDFDPLSDLLYLNNGQGQFAAQSQAIGLAEGGKGLGVVAAHFNEDAYIDLYVANDTRSNFLYLNDATGRLREVGMVSGTAVDSDGTPNGSMGLAVLDFDGDLAADIWVTNYENETCALYQNAGAGNFLWATKRAGINALGTLFVSFGTVAGDFDVDGDEDLVVTNGHIMLYPRNSKLEQENLLLVNRLLPEQSGLKTGRFERWNSSEKHFFNEPMRGRGLATGDLDADGDLDLVFSNVEQNARLLRNDTSSAGKNYLLHLIGRHSNRDAIGAVAVLRTDSGEYLRQVVGGGSYLSQSSYQLHWGIPEGEQIRQIEIRWPSGQSQVIEPESNIERTRLVIEPISAV